MISNPIARPRASTVSHAVACSAAAALCLAATISAAAADELCPKRGGILKTVEMHYSTMDPSQNVYPYFYVGLVFDSLIDVTPDMKFTPGLAESLPKKVSDVSYLFKLRQGIKFHDGTDFNADAVKFNLNRLVSGDVVSPFTGTWQHFLEKVTIVDPYTVRIDLKEPWPGFLWGVASTLHIASPTGVKKLGDRFGIDAAPGTGPFILKSINPKNRIELVRNPNYYRRGEPCLDGFIATSIASGSVRLLSLKKGDLDLVQTFPESQLPQIENAKNVTVEEGKASTLTLLAVNTRVEKLNDKQVRQAIQYGIDGQELIDNVYRGRGVMIDSIFPPWHSGYVQAEDLSPIRPDLEKARALLAEAGYGPNNPLRVEIQTGNGGAHVQRGVLLQAQLKRAGIEVTLRTVSGGQYFSNLSSGDYEMLLWQMNGGPTLKDYSWDLYSGDSTTNATGYNQDRGYQNPEADRLATVIAQADDAQDVKNEILQLQQIVFDDLPYIYVNYRNHRNAYGNWVKNFHTAALKGREDIRRVWLDR